MIAEDLSHNKQRFGNYAVHNMLSRDQLDTLRKKLPSLINEHNYVNAYLATYVFNPDATWEADLAERRAYLKQLLEATTPLPTASNHYKVAVLYQLLHLDRQEVCVRV